MEGWGEWPTSIEAYGSLLAEWAAFEKACKADKPHLWRPASTLQRLKMFQSWLPPMEFLRIAEFHEFQRLCGNRFLNIKLRSKGGIKKEHYEKFFVGTWPEIAAPPTPEYIVAALPSSEPRRAGASTFSKMMAKAQAPPPVVKAKAKAPQKGVKRSHQHITPTPTVDSPPDTYRDEQPFYPRTRYARGTPEGDRMAEALLLVEAGVKYSRASHIKGVERKVPLVCVLAVLMHSACACLLKLLLRKALSRIHRGEQALYQVAGAELVIHPQLESDLEEFITFIFNAGHGIDWGQIAEYARKLAKAMEIKGFQGSAGWIARFKERHPTLVRRRSQNMERVRAGAMNGDSCHYYFNTVLRQAYEFAEERCP